MRSKRSTLERTRRFSVVAIVPGAEAAVVANWGKIFVANRECTVLGVSISYEVASTDGGETLTIERLQLVEASGGGDDLLTAPIPIDGAIRTAHHGTVVGGATCILAAGDRLNILPSATATALQDLCVTVELQEEVGVAVRAKTAMYDTRRILLPVHLPDTIAGTALNYGVVFICPADDRFIFVGAEIVYTTKAAAAATLQLEKLLDTEAPGAGAPLLAAALPLNADAEVPQYGSITGITPAARTLAAGDRINLVDGGAAIAALRNLQVTIELEELIPIRAKQAPTENERIFVTAVLYGTQAAQAQAAMYDKFFTASKPCRVVAARAVQTTAGGDVDGFCQIEKLTGTAIPGAVGNPHLLTNSTNKGFNLNPGVDETVEVGTLTAVAADLILARGDRIALDPVDANIGAAARGLCVTVELEAIR